MAGGGRCLHGMCQSSVKLGFPTKVLEVKMALAEMALKQPRLFPRRGEMLTHVSGNT